MILRSIVQSALPDCPKIPDPGEIWGLGSWARTIRNGWHWKLVSVAPIMAQIRIGFFLAYMQMLSLRLFRLSMLGVFLALLFPAHATEPTKVSPEIIFGTAAKERAYWGFGKRFQEVATETGLVVEVEETQGSLENLQRLADPGDPMNLALTQADVLHHFFSMKPGYKGSIEVVESFGLECVFVIAAADGAPANELDWQRAAGMRVAIRGPKSGPAITHKVMGQLIPELADDVPVYMAIEQGMQALGKDGDDKVDLVFVIHRPKFDSPERRVVLAQPHRFKYLPIEDKRLKAQLPDGREVYTFLKAPLVQGQFDAASRLPTLCTNGLLVASSSKLSASVKNKLGTIVDYHWMRIYPEHAY